MDKLTEAKFLKPIDQIRGMQDASHYVCKRCEVEKVSDISERDYAHALSEYITSLMCNMKEFRKFVVTHCN